MPLDSDEFQEAALERSLGQEFQVPHFGVFRKSQSFSRTAREKKVSLKISSTCSNISSHRCNSLVQGQKTNWT